MVSQNNKFWRGMLIGALAGGAISLLDKHTRQTMKENVQRTSGKVFHVIRHPGEITDKVKETADKWMTVVEEVSEDISYIADKVEEIRELTPQVTDMIKETKNTLVKEKNSTPSEEESI